MSKVLLLCFDYPPSKAIGGFRPHSWSKYFHQNDIELTIITRHWDRDIRFEIECLKASTIRETITDKGKESRVIRTPFTPNWRDRFLLKYGAHRFTIIRKIASYLYLILPFLNLKYDQTANIYKEARNYLHQNECDVILVTGGPFILFKHASLLTKEFNIPWVADYRDTWSKNHYRNKIIFGPIDWFHSMLEAKYIKNASLITASTKGTKALLEKEISNRPIEIIYNGFDQEVLDAIGPIEQGSDLLRIAYAGSLYPPQRLDMFIEGFSTFLESTPKAKIEINFYGLGFHPEQSNRLLGFLKGPLKKHVNIIDRLPYEDLMRELRRSNLLLLLSYEGQYWLTAKVLDYLGANRKIFMVQNDKGEIEEFLNEYGDAAFCSDSREVYYNLDTLYKEFQELGKIPCNSNGASLFTRSNQARKLAELLNKVTAKV